MAVDLVCTVERVVCCQLKTVWQRIHWYCIVSNWRYYTSTGGVADFYTYIPRTQSMKSSDGQLRTYLQDWSVLIGQSRLSKFVAQPIILQVVEGRLCTGLVITSIKVETYQVIPLMTRNSTIVVLLDVPFGHFKSPQSPVPQEKRLNRCNVS